MLLSVMYIDNFTWPQNLALQSCIIKLFIPKLHADLETQSSYYTESINSTESNGPWPPLGNGNNIIINHIVIMSLYKSPKD